MGNVSSTSDIIPSVFALDLETLSINFRLRRPDPDSHGSDDPRDDVFISGHRIPGVQADAMAEFKLKTLWNRALSWL